MFSAQKIYQGGTIVRPITQSDYRSTLIKQFRYPLLAEVTYLYCGPACSTACEMEERKNKMKMRRANAARPSDTAGRRHVQT
jgi:hypothetical protein